MSNQADDKIETLFFYLAFADVLLSSRKIASKEMSEHLIEIGRILIALKSEKRKKWKPKKYIKNNFDNEFEEGYISGRNEYIDRYDNNIDKMILGVNNEK